jgi:hypothetical protein
LSLEGVAPANTNEMPAPNPEADTEQLSPAPAEAVTAPEETKLPELGEAPKEEPPKEEEKKEEISDDLPYEETGNEYIDEALSALHTGGVDFEKAFSKFSETGQESDIDMAYIESILGKSATYGILQGIKAENTKMEGEAAATAKAVHEAAGGKELWDGVCEWIASGTSGLSKEGWGQYNDMLASGGVQAELASRELSRMYQQSPGFTLPANLLQGDATAQPSGIEPISRREYAQELDQVVREKGENSQEAQVLHKRREFALTQGL